MTKNVTLTIVTILTLLFSSCSTSKTNCPNLSAARHISKPHYTHTAHNKVKHNKHNEQARETNPRSNNEMLTASNDGSIALPKKKLMELTLPAGFNERINEVGLDNVNTELGKYSKYMRVEQRGEKAFVKVSPKELAKIAGKILRAAPAKKEDTKVAKAQPEESEAMGTVALVGGILGIVSMGVSIIPLLNIFGVMLGIAALIMGAIAFRRAGKRRKWAIVAIVLGILGMLISIAWFTLFIILVFGVGV